MTQIRSCGTWLKPRLMATAGLNIDFLILSLALIAIHIPLFSHTVWYDRDTVFIFQMFYAYYNNLFLHNEFAHWLPFANYGVPNDYYQLCFIAPAQYFTGGLGWLFRIRDVNFLFKLSMLLEQWFMLLGIYLLSRTLFKKRAVIFFVSLGLVASTLWLPQLNYNCRIFSHFPLLFFLLLSFFRTQRPYFFWLTGTYLVIAQIGAPIQFVIFYFTILLIFFVSLCFRTPFPWKCLIESSRKNYFSIFLMTVTAAVYLGFACHSLDHITSLIPGRSGFSLSVPLDVFLQTNSSDTTIEKFTSLLIARYWGQDATLYLGILPLVFALYGLVTVRKPLFSIFAFMAYMLFCLSLANTTVVAKVLYYGFLPFRFLRYVGNMGAVIRFFLFLLAGYGLEHFLKNRDFRHHRKWAAANNRIFLVCSLGVLCLMLLVKAFILLIANPLFPGYEPFPGFLYFTCALTAAASWFLVQKNFTSRKLALIFILFFAADILGYQTLFQTSWPYRIHEMSRSAVRIHSFPYQASRNFSPPGDQRTNAALKLVQLNPFRLAEEMYSFLLFDPSIPSKNVPAFHWSSGVHELISLRFPDFYTSTNQPDFVRKEENQPFATIFGISQPKLRLLSNIRFANNHGTARKMISSPLFDADRLTLLEKVPASLQTRWQRTNPPANVEGTIEVKNFSFNRLGLEADVKYPGGAWLYYADAWHTGWHARVNGRTAPVSRANLAFKAVFLPPGKNFVQFDYFDGLQSLLSNLLAVTGILFCLVMSGFLFKTLVRGNTPCS